ncbi:MAG: hypothetical protein EXR93_05865 [Gemmatimonadetes bacterium]|nr:hypothetical protein [Gemmatimonadota bacterium]
MKQLLELGQPVGELLGLADLGAKLGALVLRLGDQRLQLFGELGEVELRFRFFAEKSHKSSPA